LTEQEKKKEYLKSYKVKCNKIKSLYEQIETIRTSLESAKGQIITDMPRSGNQTDLSDGIVSLENVQEKLTNAIREKENLMAEIESKIADVECGIEAIILHKKYIEDKKWEEICCDIGYSWMQTHRYHSKALNSFNMV
jgi:hypothetical protein